MYLVSNKRDRQCTYYATMRRDRATNVAVEKLYVGRGFQEVKVPRLHDNGTGWWYGCQPYAPAAFTTQEMLLILISIRD
jgi:hypothetical protein